MKHDADNPPLPAGQVPAFADVPFLGSGREEKMDVYLPAGANREPRPAVLIIHGGGWRFLDKANGRERRIAADLTAAGYVCASINYRLAAGEGSYVEALREVFPRNLQDCKSGVRFLRAHAATYGIDPARIAVTGGSAGGHLSAMVGFTRPEDKLEPAEDGLGDTPSRVSAVVPMYGVYDASLLWGGGTDAVPPGDRAFCRRVSPVAYIAPDAPPCLILHGTEDALVPVEQSRILAGHLARAGVAHRLVVVDGAPHSFDFHPGQQDLLPHVLAFLRRYL